VSGPTDPLRRLLDAVVEGDDVAAAALVRRTTPAVWRTCSALGSPGEVEDLVQETYLRAFRNLSGFRGDTTVTRWLVVVARNVCADHVRRRTRRRRLVDRVAATIVDDHTVDPAWVEVDDLLDALEADQRDAFLLTQVLGFAYAEAAEVLGCPVGTIRSRVARARARLVSVASVVDATSREVDDVPGGAASA
jgi:RNA polymerase sigma-70 factor (ECF subfamily)